MKTYEEVLTYVANRQKILAVYEGMENKRLIGGRYVKDGLYCAIGALIPDVVATYEFPEQPIHRAPTLLAALYERYGLDKDIARTLQDLNDGTENWPFYKKYKTRYERILAFSKNMVGFARFVQQSHSGYLTDPNRTR